MNDDEIRDFQFDTSVGTVRVRILGLDNGSILLISSTDSFRLGLTALAVPPGQGRTEPTSTGLFTAGLDATLVRTMAERIVSWLGSPCLLILSVNGFNRALMMELLVSLKNHLLA